MSQCPHIDLASPETYIGGAPLEGYRALRRSQPVYWFEDKTLEPFWVVTGQEELDFISKHPLLFSSAEKTCFYHETEPEMLPLMRLMLINMDPPDHIKYRRIVRSAFTPKAMDAYESRFREIAKGLIDRVIDKGRCEFVEEVAAELPLVAICELMGIPIEDRKQFFEWTNIMLGADDPELTTSPEDGQMAMMGLFEYGRKLAIRYRENPEPCIVGSLLDGEVEGEKLTEDEFCYFFLLLIVAGNETTRTVTSHGMRLLMEHPEQYRMLVDNPALIPDAIEEFLRYNPAVIQFRRTAMEDVEVGGQLIRKGDKVMLNYQAASHDERLFTDPDRFDITRQQREDVRNQHRAFGFGQHFCLGSHLARLELKVIFEEIIGRIRNPELVGEIRWLRSMLINGIKEMNIKFDKAA